MYRCCSVHTAIRPTAAAEMRKALPRRWILVLLANMLITLPSLAHGGGNERVTGLGLGVDLQSSGANPVPSAGLLLANFGVLSYQARATVSHRFSDDTTFFRAGVGAGFIMFLLNFDVTMQTGAQNSAGIYWGISAFLSGSYLTPEIFAGHQVNFAANADNLVLAGFKCYLNFSELAGEHR